MLSILYSFPVGKKKKSLRKAAQIQIGICSHTRRKERKEALALVNAHGKKIAAKKDSH